MSIYSRPWESLLCSVSKSDVWWSPFGRGLFWLEGSHERRQKVHVCPPMHSVFFFSMNQAVENKREMTTTQRLNLAVTVSWRRKERRKNSSYFWNFYSTFTINSSYNGLIHMTWRHTIFFHEYKKIYISKEWKEWFILTQADVPKTTKNKKRVLLSAPRTLR